MAAITRLMPPAAAIAVLFAADQARSDETTDSALAQSCPCWRANVMPHRHVATQSTHRRCRQPASKRPHTRLLARPRAVRDLPLPPSQSRCLQLRRSRPCSLSNSFQAIVLLSVTPCLSCAKPTSNRAEGWHAAHRHTYRQSRLQGLPGHRIQLPARLSRSDDAPAPPAREEWLQRLRSPSSSLLVSRTRQ